MSDSRKRLDASDHPDKDVRKALKRILEGPFELVKGGHWGMLRCDNGCCQISVSGSPRNAPRHALELLREAAKCPRDDGDVRNKLR
ncbi:hypothetical protein [Nocardioides limicola]|uniref:hypothetical protein n=1 Tax=Nocardioides limicola TaxID=2803368 RepID=UPI00193B098F|nr:hypothetical protein [Nocardioides sp. DJM-14]